MSWTYEGHPVYPEDSASTELWGLEAQRSADWAQDARHQARRRRRRENVIAGVMLFLTLLVILITVGVIAATIANAIVVT
jgi:hypothetical protein